VKRGSVCEFWDEDTVSESVASKYGLSIDSGDKDGGSRRGIEKYTIPVWHGNSSQT
jgi:hypothetical protein